MFKIWIVVDDEAIKDVHHKKDIWTLGPPHNKLLRIVIYARSVLFGH
jgi:hypothetical protein